jgi:hypothetical protein
MATKSANISDFLKGLLMGAWLGVSTSPKNSKAVLEEALRKRRESEDRDARHRSEIGFVPHRK